MIWYTVPGQLKKKIHAYGMGEVRELPLQDLTCVWSLQSCVLISVIKRSFYML
jgi:hypothetical protein